MNKKEDYIENQLDPMCLKNEVHVAITNQGELIPCCYLDNPKNNLDPEYKKLLILSPEGCVEFFTVVFFIFSLLVYIYLIFFPFV